MFRVEKSFVVAIHLGLRIDMLCEAIASEHKVRNLGWTCRSAWMQTRHSGVDVLSDCKKDRPKLLLHRVIAFILTWVETCVCFLAMPALPHAGRHGESSDILPCLGHTTFKCTKEHS